MKTENGQSEIDWAASDYSYHYNDVEPVHSGLMHNPPLNVETSHHSSSSVTVSIFGALSEILSHTTESLSFLTSTTTTESTPQSHTHSTFLHSTYNANDDLKPIQKIQWANATAAATATTKHIDQMIHIPSTKQQHNEISESFGSNEDLAVNIKSSLTTSTPSFEHNTSNEQVDANFNSNVQNRNKKHSNSTNMEIYTKNITNHNIHNNNNEMTTKQSATTTAIQMQSLMPTLNKSNHYNNSTHMTDKRGNGIMIVLAKSTKNDRQFKNENISTTKPTKSRTIPMIEKPSNTIKTVQFNVTSPSPTFKRTPLNNVISEQKLKSHHSNLTNASMNISIENVMPIYPVYETTTIQSFKTNANKSVATISLSIDRPAGVDLQMASKAKPSKITTPTKAMMNATIPSTMATLMTITKSITTIQSPAEQTPSTSTTTTATTTTTTEQSVNIFNNFDKIHFKIPKNTNINDPIVNNEPNLPKINEKPLTNTSNAPIESTTTSWMMEFIGQIATTNANVVNMTSELEVFNRKQANATNIEFQTMPTSTPTTNDQITKITQLDNYDKTELTIKRSTMQTRIEISTTTNRNESPTESGTELNVPRFKTRIAALPIGFYSLHSHSMATESPAKPSPSQQTNKIFNVSQLESATVEATTMPIIIHRQQSSTTMATTRKSRRFDFDVYGILSNNTVVRRLPEDIYDDDVNNAENPNRNLSNEQIVYAILGNNTVLRKYPNGTTEIDRKRSNRTFEITDIDPKSLLNPNSDFYKQQFPSHNNTYNYNINNNSDSINQTFRQSDKSIDYSNLIEFNSTTDVTTSNNNKNVNNTTTTTTTVQLMIMMVFYLPIYTNIFHNNFSYFHKIIIIRMTNTNPLLVEYMYIEYTYQNPYHTMHSTFGTPFSIYFIQHNASALFRIDFGNLDLKFVKKICTFFFFFFCVIWALNYGLGVWTLKIENCCKSIQDLENQPYRMAKAGQSMGCMQSMK